MISKDGTRIPDGAKEMKPELLRDQKRALDRLIRELALISHMPHQLEEDDKELEDYIAERAAEEFEKARSFTREERWGRICGMRGRWKSE